MLPCNRFSNAYNRSSSRSITNREDFGLTYTNNRGLPCRGSYSLSFPGVGICSNT